MALGVRGIPAVSVIVCAGAAFGQSAPIVQPGAPGQTSKVLAPSAAIVKPRAPAAADVEFMQGMIHHHAQAVEMVDLMRTHTRNQKLLALGNRISISQTDEIQFMKQWLLDRNQPVMPYSHMGHGAMPLMPGMLTPEQMKALAKAKGPAFDRLFLTGMIQHHTGALIMVEDLFDVAGTGQDNFLYEFATDVDNTQRAEIEIMKSMLKEKK